MNIEDEIVKVNSCLAKILVSIFICILIMPTILWGCITLFWGNNDFVKKYILFELNEKRVKAELPNGFDNNITSDLEKYYNDRIPFRNFIIRVNTKTDSLMDKIYFEHISPKLVDIMYGEKKEYGIAQFDDTTVEQLFGEIECVDNLEHKWIYEKEYEATLEYYGYTLFRCDNCGKTKKDNYIGKLIDYNFTPPYVYNGITVLGRSNWLFYSNENSLDYFCGKNILSDTEMEEYADLINTLQSLCDKENKKVCFLIVPNKEEVYTEYMPSYIVDEEYKRTERMLDYFSVNTKSTFIYPIKEFEVCKKNWQLYYKHDTHWNDIGSFIALQTLYKKRHMPTTNLENLEIEQSVVNGGDLIDLGALDETQYSDDFSYIIEYKEDVNIINQEGSFAENDTFKSYSESENKEKLAMIGDSYRTYMAKYITKDFSVCNIAHYYSMKGDAFRKSIKDADVIIVECAQRYDYRIKSISSYLIEVLSD